MPDEVGHDAYTTPLSAPFMSSVEPARALALASSRVPDAIRVVPVNELEPESASVVKEPVLIRPPAPNRGPTIAVDAEPATVRLKPPLLTPPVNARLPAFAAREALAVSTSGD